MRESKDYMMNEMIDSGSRRNYRGSYTTSNVGVEKPNLSVRSVITDYQNFLRDAPILRYNQKPNADGLVVFKNDKLSAYSTI